MYRLHRLRLYWLSQTKAIDLELQRNIIVSMSHKKDSIGFPLDPQLRRLEFRLGNLAAEWRQFESPERQHEIVQEYHAVMEQLYQLGWDAILDTTSELPDEFMPEEYCKRYPIPPDCWYI